MDIEEISNLLQQLRRHQREVKQAERERQANESIYQRREPTSEQEQEASGEEDYYETDEESYGDQEEVNFNEPQRENENSEDYPVVTEDFETGDPELDNILAKLKELKAKKIVLSFELNQSKSRLEDTKSRHKELLKESDASFEEWILSRMKTLDYMLDSTTLDIPEVQKERTNEETKGEQDFPEERKELLKKLREARIGYMKLLKYIELSDSVLEETKIDKEAMITNKQTISVQYDEEIEKMTEKRLECEKRTAGYRLLLSQIKEQNEDKRREMELINKKIEKTQTRTARELQFLAKQLLK